MRECGLKTWKLEARSDKVEVVSTSAPVTRGIFREISDALQDQPTFEMLRRVERDFKILRHT
jgi:hypothetical protein